ncbi:chemotaxis protein CheW [Anaerolineales bacterium HSG25]|nr:chemotaxis protein CheW [Anaerolineales bacterium HSG25]
MKSTATKNGHYTNGHQIALSQPQTDVDEEALSPEELRSVWERRALELARPPETEAIGETIDLLVFRLNDEQYGIEVTNVREIYPLEKITVVPRTPEFVVGVYSARGRILSVVDLHAFWGMSANNPTEGSKIIAVTNTNPNAENSDMELGLLADQVEDVVTIFKDTIDTSFINRSNNSADYMYGITSELLEVIDLNGLLDDKRLVINEEVL